MAIDINTTNRSYEAQFTNKAGYQTEEFLTEAEARALVEANGHGSVVTWSIRNNLPYALPKRVHKSLALDVFQNGEWKQVYIF